MTYYENTCLFTNILSVSHVKACFDEDLDMTVT